MEVINETDAAEPRQVQGFSVGDEVNYVPGEAYAFSRDPLTGDLPWVIGLNRMGRDGQPYTEELVGDRIREVFDAWRRAPDPAEFRKHLVLLRPAKVWKARVRHSWPDESLDLDIESYNGGVTLHHDHVPHDPQKSAHSCHRK